MPSPLLFRARPIIQVQALLVAGIMAILVGGGLHLWQGHYGPGADEAGAMISATEADVVERPVVAEAADEAPATTGAPTQTALAGLRQLMDTAEAISLRPETVTRVVEIEAGDALYDTLAAAGLDAAVASQVQTAVRSVYDLRKLRAGQEITLTITRRGVEETLDGLTLQPEATVDLTVTRSAEGQYVAQRIITPPERRRFAQSVTIQGSLIAAADKAGLPRNVVANIVRMYSHQVDFQRDVKAGDRLDVLYEQGVAKNGSRVGEATVIFANLRLGRATHPLYRVIFRDGSADYFNERGQTVRRGLLRTPIDGARLTSGFGMRRHPILGYSKMHTGVDFGASIGTPIFAAGDGVVKEVGWKGAYGRAVVIRHNDKISTLYAHQSRFAKGLKVGDRVKQGEVIGYVGNSGRSTGPHLHYEVRVNNKAVNPLKVSPNTGRSLNGTLLVEFRRGVDRIQREFRLVLSGQQPGSAKVAATEAP